jgi:hypothetical protein
MRLILRLLLAASAVGALNNIYFEQKHEVFNAHEVLHVTLGFDSQTLLNQCDEFRKALRLVGEGYNTSYLTAVWFSAVAVVKSSCDFDHIYPGESRRTMEATPGQRDKRQILGGLAIFGTLFGLYNWGTIHELSNTVATLQHHLRDDVVLLQHHETRMGRMEEDMKMVNASLATVIRAFNMEDRLIQKLFWMQNFMLQFDVLQQHLATWRQGWTALHAQRLPLDWMASATLPNVLTKLRATAAKMGGVLPITHQMDLFDLPTSFMWDDKVIRVFVHLPVIKEKMDLFQLLPVPIRVGERYIKIRAEKEFLLISKGNRIHQETTGQELQNKCHKLGAYFMCEDLGVFRRNMRNTCLGRLFSNDIQNIEEKCIVEEIHNDWEIVQTAHNRFIVYTKDEQNLVLECRNGTRRNRRLSGVQLVEADDNCLTYTPEFELRPSTATSIRLMVVQEVAWNVTALVQSWDRMTQQGDLLGMEELRNLTLTSGQDRDADRRLGEDLIRRADAAGTNHEFLWPMAGVSTLLGLMAIGLVGYLAWRYWRYVRTSPSAPDPSHSSEGGR